MFRKLKKLYFKIYHLFKLIGVFLVVFGLWNNVYAVTFEERDNNNLNFKIASESCSDNLFYGTIIKGVRYINTSATYKTLKGVQSSYLIPVENSTTYTISFNENINFQYIGIAFLDSNVGTSKPTITNMQGQYTNITFTTNSDTTYVGFTFNNIPNENIDIMMNKGSDAQTYVEYSTNCGGSEPGDNVYSGFLTIYFDRITYLAEGFTNNPYLIAMVGIIFGFVVLDLLLKILNIRRKK